MHTKLKIREFLEQFFGDHQLRDDEDLFSTGYVSSLFAMQLVMFIEKEFQIHLKNEELDLKNFQSIDRIANFLEQLKVENV
ncbi:phosphopantetheine-binding protein [Paucisalibacillus globulus]|jgi:methoxymalonate biosynthesis acyl carrier protein|uniref:phosphopantetheine-binding protein n=1 Tax=Paucisalibacillus globulus TaxID=351095 RepID=UPI00040C5EF6|nr:phosphopantetheine-binding protein [Paucisalibacillus globulus]